MAYLVVKNWDSFQHYKDRSPPWIKLHKGLLDDFDYQRLPLASRALAPMIWLLASESNDGAVEYNIEKLAFRLRTSVDEVEQGLTPLIDKGFLLVASNPLASAVHSACLETETETEIETETSLVASKPATEVCPHQEIIKLYAEILPELPQPRIWEGQRQQNLASRWRWVLSDQKAKGKPADREAGLEFFRRMFEYIHRSDFLMGRAGRWSADLAWIVKAEPFAKILQGNYENKDAA